MPTDVSPALGLRISSKACVEPGARLRFALMMISRAGKML
jgi:hypothetical protein